MVEKIIQLIEKKVDSFDASLSSVERELFAEIQLVLKSLELDDAGNIKSTTANLYRIQVIKSKIERIMQSPAYTTKVILFSNTINEITSMSKEYLKNLGNFQPTKYMLEYRKVAIKQTRESLGLASKTTKNPEFTQRVVNRAMYIIRGEVTNGSSFMSVNEQLRDFMLSDKDGVGALRRYSKQVTTDALNQYTANYMMRGADELGLEWFEYLGELVRDSRPWCEHMRQKRWVHRSELPELPMMFKVPANPKTGLPQGMIAGTNGDNILQRRGGWNCGHQFAPVMEESVPKKVRNARLETAT